jgi:hypothetical protein
MLALQVVLLTPSKSSHPLSLLSRQQTAPISPLAATLMDLHASVANKRLAVGLTPLDATLTKDRGDPAFRRLDVQPITPLLSITRHLSLFSSSPFNGLHTLPSSVSCKSCICRSYENCLVYTNKSHSGTQNAPQSFFPTHSNGGTASLPRYAGYADLSKRSNVRAFQRSDVLSLPVDILPFAGHNFCSALSSRLAPITEEGE